MSRRSVRGLKLLSVLAAAAGVVGFQAAGASPAFAVSGIEVVHANSSTGHPDWNRAYARCPAGKVAIGGGGDIVGGGHGVRLGDASVHGDTYEASAAANSAGYTTDWTLHAYAVCAYPPAGLVRPDNGAHYTPATNYHSISVACPAGTKLISPGVWLNYTQGRVFLNELRPYGDLSGFTAAIHDDGAPNIGLTIGASSMCATPLPGLQMVSASSANNSLDKSATVECPAGKRVVSVGGAIYGAGGHAYLDRLVPHGAGWNGADVEAREDRLGTTGSWTASVYAICAY